MPTSYVVVFLTECPYDPGRTEPRQYHFLRASEASGYWIAMRLQERFAAAGETLQVMTARYGDGEEEREESRRAEREVRNFWAMYDDGSAARHLNATAQLILRELVPVLRELAQEVDDTGEPSQGAEEAAAAAITPLQLAILQALQAASPVALTRDQIISKLPTDVPNSVPTVRDALEQLRRAGRLALDGRYLVCITFDGSILVADYEEKQASQNDDDDGR